MRDLMGYLKPAYLLPLGLGYLEGDLVDRSVVHLVGG